MFGTGWVGAGWVRLVPALAMAITMVLGACASSNGSARSADNPSMTPEEAREIVREFAAKHGTAPPAQGDPTSLQQVLDILLSDQTNRFEGAIRFLEGKQGGDILTVRALLELSWSDGLTTASDVLDELSRRKELEVRRLQEKEDSGAELSPAESESLERFQQQVDEGDRARVACEVLARVHLDAAWPLASEAVKQSPPGTVEPLTAVAFYYLLAGKWLEYDEVMDSLQRAAANTAMVQYLRALESVSRFTLRDQAREELAEALRLEPKFVRAQAKLVLLQDDIDATYGEFTKLKAVSPGHPVVTLVGQLVTEERQYSAAMNKLRGK